MATRNIVPRANNEGNIGTSLKNWMKGWFTDLFVLGGLTDGVNTISISDIASITQNTSGDVAVNAHQVTYNHSLIATSVQNTLEVNGKVLSGNITLNHTDIDVPFYIRFNISNPSDYYKNVEHYMPVWIQTDAAITISSIKVSCDLNPATELNWDLCFADTYIDKANEVTINAMDTTAGVFSETSSFTDATVPSGKDMYVKFIDSPDATINNVSGTIKFTYD